MKPRKLILCGLMGVLVAGGRCFAAESTWEIRGEVVSLKPGDPETVLLKVGSGQVLEVPLASFAEAQRSKIVGAKTNVASAVGPVSEPSAAPEIEAVAQASRTAIDAAGVYHLYVASPGLPDPLKKEAEAALAMWSERAARGEVRLGKEWVDPARASAAHREAEAHVRQALQMLRIGNGQVAEDELRKASRADPASGTADFIQGLAALMGPRSSVEKAGKFFREVVDREPDHGPALNNLALCEVGNRRLSQAAGLFREAAAHVPDPQLVVGNVASVIRLAADRRNRVAPKQLEEFTQLYRWLIDERGLTPVDGQAAMLVYLSLTGSPLGAAGVFGPEAVTQPQGVGQPTRVGTGFVLAPTFVVVPTAVIANGGAVTIRGDLTTGQELPAQAVASGGGLTLLRCEGLATPAIPLAAACPSPGAELRVLHPRLQAGAPPEPRSVKATVVTQPEAGGTLPRLVYSAEGDRHRVGGFLVDTTGRFVGMTTTTPDVPAVGPALHVAAPVEAILPLLQKAGATVAPADVGSVIEAKRLAEGAVRVSVHVPAAGP